MNPNSAPYGQQVEYIGDDLFIQHCTIVAEVPFRSGTVQAIRHFRVSSVWNDATRRRQLATVHLFSPLTGCWEKSDAETRSRWLDGAVSSEWIRTVEHVKLRGLIWHKTWNDEELVTKAQAVIEDFLEREGLLDILDEYPELRPIGDSLLCRMEFV